MWWISAKYSLLRNELRSDSIALIGVPYSLPETSSLKKLACDTMVSLPRRQILACVRKCLNAVARCCWDEYVSYITVDI